MFHGFDFQATGLHQDHRDHRWLFLVQGGTRDRCLVGEKSLWKNRKKVEFRWFQNVIIHDYDYDYDSDDYDYDSQGVEE